MSANFWLGVVAIVCMLEFVRIALSVYVLVHILESRAVAAGPGEARTARQSLDEVEVRRRREALVGPTLTALRGAMDELHYDRPGPHVRAAVVALDSYLGASSSETVH